MAFRGDSTDTYTYVVNSTGGTVDLGARNNYRYVNAENVYTKGKADGAQTPPTISFTAEGGLSFSGGTYTGMQFISGNLRYLSSSWVYLSAGQKIPFSTRRSGYQCWSGSANFTLY